MGKSFDFLLTAAALIAGILLLTGHGDFLLKGGNAELRKAKYDEAKMTKGSGVALILIGILTGIDSYTEGMASEIIYVILLLLVMVGLGLYLKYKCKNNQNRSVETISKFPRSCYFSGYFLTKKIDEIHWLTDDLIRFRYISESIGSKDKRNASLAAGKEISHGVTDINRGFHIISSGDEGDVGTLIEIVITIAQMTFEIFAEAGGFKKYFNIAGLTVAHDIQRVFLS